MPFVRKSWPLFVAVGLALLALVVFRVFLNWGALGLTVKLRDSRAFWRRSPSLRPSSNVPLRFW